MSITTLSIQKDATSLTVDGGTAAVHQIDGLDVKNGNHVVDTSEPNFVLRPHGTFKNRPASLQQNGKFSKGVRGVNYTIPYTEADGSISYLVYRGTFDIPPTAPTALITELRNRTAQTVIDSDLDSFYNYGTVN